MDLEAGYYWTFGEVIVHVFDKENRLFYDLERIWSDGKMIDIEEL